MRDTLMPILACVVLAIVFFEIGYHTAINQFACPGAVQPWMRP